MQPDQTIVRKSPFLFLKWVVVVEFLFALAPVVLSVALNLQADYEASSGGRGLPYSALLVIVVTTLQVAAIALAFAAWFVASYRIDQRQVSYERGPFYPPKQLAATQTIVDVQVRQGWLARRMDYGTLVIRSAHADAVALVKDIPNPQQQAELITSLIAPQQVVAAPDADALRQLIAGGENQYVEFKSSLLWDYHRQTVNKDLYEPVMKNLAAFMNTAGGAVIVGVDDDGQALGVEKDFAGLPKKNIDGWENAFNNAFNAMIGAEFRRFAELSFYEVDGLTVCLARVQPAVAPVYVTLKGKEEFYIRTGNSSQPLSVSKASRYIQTHFRSPV